MDPYNPYGQQQIQDPNAPAEGDRGIGKALLIGAAAATTAVVGYGIYSHVSNKKKKKKVTKREIGHDGTSRDITVEVDCDPNDPEGYEVPEGYAGAPAGYGAPAPGYGAPPPGYGAYGAPAPGYGAPAPGYGAYGAPAPGYDAYGNPVGAPPGYGAYGAPAPGYGAPPPGY
eukprot:CAMPEP_0184652100 /NCGR_PEP_ID=MMETSP0308-20130426/9780_1 /TAXON_ID=38269 /ORGANISM="Gloeochaete witrockiana, Strain SAG 46.84" /LENGTH=170 /DNA_ID=CAMNT_0027086769 /DNA_START=41 /DNA_END=553 /DNA_ORIENTATION=+